MIAALILALLGPRPDAERIAKLAPMFTEESESEGIDPRITVAVAFRESSLRVHAVGLHRERGLMQVKPGGQERRHCRGLRWRTNVRHNIRCGVRILAMAKRRCGGHPMRWLGIYNGVRKCGPTRYARKVLQVIE